VEAHLKLYNKSATIDFEIGEEQLYRYTDKGERYIPKGNFKVMIGGSLPSQRSVNLGATKWQEIEVKR